MRTSDTATDLVSNSSGLRPDHAAPLLRSSTKPSPKFVSESANEPLLIDLAVSVRADLDGSLLNRDVDLLSTLSIAGEHRIQLIERDHRL